MISVAAATTLLGGAGLTVSAGMIACGSAAVPITAVTIGATVVTGAVVGAGVLLLIGGAYYLYKRKKNNATTVASENGTAASARSSICQDNGSINNSVNTTIYIEVANSLPEENKPFANELLHRKPAERGQLQKEFVNKMSEEERMAGATAMKNLASAADSLFNLFYSKESSFHI